MIEYQQRSHERQLLVLFFERTSFSVSLIINCWYCYARWRKTYHFICFSLFRTNSAVNQTSKVYKSWWISQGFQMMLHIEYPTNVFNLAHKQQYYAVCDCNLPIVGDLCFDIWYCHGCFGNMYVGVCVYVFFMRCCHCVVSIVLIWTFGICRASFDLLCHIFSWFLFPAFYIGCIVFNHGFMSIVMSVCGYMCMLIYMKGNLRVDVLWL